MTIQVFGQIGKRISDHSDKIRATRHGTTKATNDVPLRKVIGHHQHLAVNLEPVRGTLDQIIRRLSTAGKNHLDRAAGLLALWFAAPGTRAVKEYRDWRAAGILILREHFYQRVASRLGMPRRTLGQLRPMVKQ